MQKLLTFLLIVTLWFGWVQPAPVNAALLTPCKSNPAFMERAKNAMTDTAKARFERYGQLMCGQEGLPHLIVDGSLAHAGEFVIPGILFLYIAGWIGWVGRVYLQSIKRTDNPEQREIIIDVPKAIGIMLTGFVWPLAALREWVMGELTAKDDEISVSVR
jgi:photosystem I subunit 3